MPRHRIFFLARLGAALAGAALLASCGWMAVPPNRTGAASPNAAAALSQTAAPPGSVIVQAGDTVYGIARRNNVPIRAIIDANHLEPPYTLRTGQQLVVPHPQVHVVKAGETLYGVARQHQVDASALVRANDIKAPYKILVGQVLILPGQVASEPPTAQPAAPIEVQRVELLPPPGTSVAPPPAATAPPGSSAPAAASSASGATQQTASIAPVPLPVPATPPSAEAAPGQDAPAPGATVASLPPATTTEAPETPAAPAPAMGGNGHFLWPIRGTILSGFGPKEGGLYNDGINIAVKPGATVIAADDGVVAYAGNEIRGFGNLVLIKHSNGWMTAYAHNDALLVKRGQHVARGQPIAKAGSSGSVTAPQLHFEVRHGSHAVDPMKYLATISS